MEYINEARRDSSEEILKTITDERKYLFYYELGKYNDFVYIAEVRDSEGYDSVNLIELYHIYLKDKEVETLNFYDKAESCGIPLEVKKAYTQEEIIRELKEVGLYGKVRRFIFL